MLNDLTTQEFTNEVLESGEKVVVLYSQTTCMPCKVVANQLANVEGTKVAKVNITETPELNTGEILGEPVMSTPTVFVFEGGKVVEEYRGQGQSMRIVAMLMG